MEYTNADYSRSLRRDIRGARGTREKEDEQGFRRPGVEKSHWLEFPHNS